MGASRYQVAALPLRHGPDGVLQIMLITSRERHRWIIPKGWPMKGKADCEAASIEAYEEAGLQGTINESPLGSYDYIKINRRGEGEPITVQVYLMHVDKREETWPEKGQRVSLWYDLDEALIVLDEPGLAELIMKQRRKIR
jgi:8-oxo-dGTP pyrophosphatase MutT (NUDIX family)